MCAMRCGHALVAGALACKYRGGLHYQIATALDEFSTFARPQSLRDSPPLATTVDT